VEVAPPSEPLSFLVQAAVEVDLAAAVLSVVAILEGRSVQADWKTAAGVSHAEALLLEAFQMVFQSAFGLASPAVSRWGFLSEA